VSLQKYDFLLKYGPAVFLMTNFDDEEKKCTIEVVVMSKFAVFYTRSFSISLFFLPFFPVTKQIS